METIPNDSGDQPYEGERIDEQIMTELAKSAALYSPGLYTVEHLETTDREPRKQGT